ncbi:hypothetical protein F5051DRAFT_503496 [Lentinula edodes]|nr:hypothetical protein F5051DRAFT_503496 [Lentinula edodes]
MPTPPDLNEKGPSAPSNRNHEALSTSHDDGMESSVNGELQPEWTIGEEGGTEHRRGMEESKETDERRAVPQVKTVEEGQTKDCGHGSTTGLSTEETGRMVGQNAIGPVVTTGAVAVGESPKKTKKKAGAQAAPRAKAKMTRKSELVGEKGPGEIQPKPRTRGSTASPTARPLTSTMSTVTVDTEESGDEPLTVSLLSPTSEGPAGIGYPPRNLPMEAQVEKEYGIDLDMSSVSKVIQVASKLKKTAIAVGGRQMEVWSEFRNETTTLRRDMGKLEERVVKAETGRAGGEKIAGDSVQRQEMVQLKSRVQNLEKVALKLPTGSEIDVRVATAISEAKEEMAGVCKGVQGEMRALRGVVKNDVKIVSKEARDEGKAVRGELKGDIQRAAAGTKEGMKEMKGQMRLEMENKSNEQRKKAEAYTAKVEDMVKDLVARMEKLERETCELEAKNRDLENRVDRMAHEGRQEEEAQVERMSERAREVTGYGAHQKRMGEEETVYDSRSGKVPRGNYAESVHDMGGRGNGHRDFRQNESHTRGSYQHNRAYGMPPPRLGQLAPTAPAKDKQDLRLAIGVFRGRYATATVGEQIALIAQTVPRSFIPSDARRDDYRFGLLVMTFRSYNDRDAFTQEWSAHYKNSLLEREGLKLRGIGEDF